MGYFVNCEKCNVEIGHEEFRFYLNDDCFCYDCYLKIENMVYLWLKEELEKVN